MPQGPLHRQILGADPVRQQTALLFPPFAWLMGQQPHLDPSSSAAIQVSMLPRLPSRHDDCQARIARQRLLQACYEQSTPTRLPDLIAARQMLLQLLNPDAQWPPTQQPPTMKSQGDQAQRARQRTPLLSMSLRCWAVSTGLRFVQNMTVSEPLLLHSNLRRPDCGNSLLQIAKKTLPINCHHNLVRANCIDRQCNVE